VSTTGVERLRAIKTFPSLVKYLRDELDWPITTDDVEELTFEYQPEELGLEREHAAKVKEVKQLRPLSQGQPWGIFWLNFEPKRLPVVVLRRILQAVVVKKRASANRAQRAAWQLHDLLFISAYGESNERAITFVHFSEPPDERAGDLPTLRVLGWDTQDTVLHVAHAEQTLRDKLRWPRDERDIQTWRQRWADAFVLRHREVITTSRDLAIRLADLARRIRDRAMLVLNVETERGALQRLYKAFQEALVHDLKEPDFADMYAQTIAYGLLAARVSRPVGVIADNLADMVPITNPFLKEMLGTFLTAGGRKRKIDFDELGIQEVVDLLNSPDTHMEAVLRDFGRSTRQEDPVIHFYELFLAEYDKKLKVQRGVFYTPKPVVSYIVRSVHEILQIEFGLNDGLASTVTWGEMAQRRAALKIPEGIKPTDPFVTILDPATGTATFLVECVDVIHQTLAAKWNQLCLTEAQQRGAWNDYVPKHLLPRLHGYELMMAPYAIAHMKLGLKLFETGYRFGSKERARIYLTNSLEPPQDFSDRLAFDAPALAHEAQAVNAIKRHQRFTVIIGNPPYSKISANLAPEMRATVERYRYVQGERIKERGALQFEINLQDDYVKFFRLCEGRVNASYVGVVGLITNNGYLSTPTLRGMRDSLLETFSSIRILDLHGHLAKGELGPEGEQEENIFDILQGVALFIGSRALPKASLASVVHTDRYGSRAGKYEFLQSNTLSSTNFSRIEPSLPFYLFVPHDADLTEEWNRYIGLTDLFPRNSAGIITARDGLVIDEERRALAERLERFSNARGGDASIYEEFGFSESKRFDLRAAQAQLRKLKSFLDPIRRILHRPFDQRYIFFHPSVVWSLSRPMADQMNGGDNLALVATRQVTRPQFEHAFVSRHIIEIKACSHDRNTQIFPLFIRNSDGELALSSGTMPNIQHGLLAKLASILGLKLRIETREYGREHELTPLALFYYAYATLYCPSYRDRYFEFLRSDFPRLPLPENLKLFRSMARLGSELVSLHLMESPKLDRHFTRIVGSGRPEVEKASYKNKTVWIDKEQTQGFQGVPEDVWDFHIGGYQVCEKWLKDRKGRTLTKQDIEHYHRIVVSLHETIRLMAEIDKIIDAHGSWPGAFTARANTASEKDLPVAAESSPAYPTGEDD